MQSVSVLLKPVSGTCNMKCDYCFYCDEAKKRARESYGMMSEQTLKNVIRKTMLRAEREAVYAFQGGEPTLRGISFFERVVELEKQYNRNGIAVHNVLQTNGYLIDEAWCEFLKKNHFLVGLSVDGIKETHDSFRHTTEGEATFERVCHAADLLKRYGVDYNILTVVNKRTASEIAEIYRFYKEKGWQYQQYIVCLEPFGEKRGEMEYALTPEAYGKFLIQLFQLWYEDAKRGEAPFIRQFENYINLLNGYQPEACEQRGICGMQTVVEADGSVYPCDFYVFDEYLLGNFNENRLDEIYAAPDLSNFIERSAKIADECGECSYYKLCRGGCQRNREFDVRRGTYRNYFCAAYKMFFGACLEQMETLKAEV